MPGQCSGTIRYEWDKFGIAILLKLRCTSWSGIEETLPAPRSHGLWMQVQKISRLPKSKAARVVSLSALRVW